MFCEGFCGGVFLVFLVVVLVVVWFLWCLVGLCSGFACVVEVFVMVCFWLHVIALQMQLNEFHTFECI